MNLNQWYEQGLTPDHYITDMQTHQDGLMHIYNNLKLPDDEAFFATLQDKNLRVIVLTEDWCGDAMLNIPVLLRLTDEAMIPVKMLLRDQNLDLMDNYLTNGKSRSIPIFIFIDEDGQEVAKWGPRASEIQKHVDQQMATLPDKEAPDFQSKQKEMFQTLMQNYQESSAIWLAVYNDLKHTLTNV